MATEPSDWKVAYNRFGLGPRRGESPHAGDPREALRAELEAPGGARLEDSALRSTSDILGDVFAYDQQKKMEREAAVLAKLAGSAMPAPEVAPLLFPVPQATPAMAPGAPEPPPQQKAFRADAKARLERACAAPVGYVERLVAFWSNHFCVSVAKSDIGRGAAGAFEREAIRPHVLGKFAGMLLAVEQHPVMLNFLDNAQSVGPNSRGGHNNGKGLNENLAREILELHTLGAGSGYTQTDVTQLAYILTGWTIAGRDGKLGEPGTFVFNEANHEPTAATLIDRVYTQDGVAQGEAALRDLAREGATARHISYKFARHFVADSPDPALVKRLAQVFNDTDGDLAALARALIDDPQAWSAPPAKIRNPWELSVASYRAFGRAPDDPGPVLNAMNLLGMPLWQPAGPNGFSDEAAAWTSPEGMKTRVELAIQFARQLKDPPAPLALIEDVMPSASAATREAATRAESREQAYALLILSPEFQRR
jgi:uncharacterized protein (DUF1800 family)